MVNGVQNTYTYNGEEYRRKSAKDAEIGAIAASVASAAIMAVLPSFSNPFIRQIKKEHKNNDYYKDTFTKAVEISGLKEKGLYIEDIRFRYGEQNLSPSQVANYDVKAGMNAFYDPKARRICLNTGKSTITGFHELGHAMNDLKGGFGKLLQKCRVPGYTLAGIMGTIALTSREKPKEAKRDLKDIVLDNCGLIAFTGMLPTVTEEAMASYKGIKMAKQAGLSEPLVKNLKKFYGKAWLSYVGYAVLTGLSVFATGKIMQLFTRPEKIERR